MREIHDFEINADMTIRKESEMSKTGFKEKDKKWEFFRLTNKPINKE